MANIPLDSELLQYIVRQRFSTGARLPTIKELSAELGSISKVREELEVARALGVLEVRSKTGMRMLEYSFAPAVRLSLFYALACDLHHFEAFSQLRNHIEIAFWDEACKTLTDDDFDIMRRCINQARAKLRGDHILIPNEEHRAFHLQMFRKLDNPFVSGILEAYWDAYDAVELNRYADYAYFEDVWNYHERILNALSAGENEQAKALFEEHAKLIRFRRENGHHAPLQPTR